MQDVPQVGEILKVIAGMPERQNSKLLEAGDVVEVIGNYEHICMVRKLKKGKDGYQTRQCYPNDSWKINLERLGGKQ